MSQPDTIRITNLLLGVHIGVTDEEQAAAQRLTVSLTLYPAQPFTGLGDCIENTINYAEVCKTIRELAAASRRRLVETLAEDIAAGVLAGFAACAAVDVELRKYILPDTDYVAVRLSRHRVSHP